MAAKSDKRIDSLPILSKPEEFEDWKRDIEIWKAITSVDVTKQGPILYRSLEGQAKKACSNIPVGDICGDQGYTLLIKKLTEIFSKDNEQKAFEDCRTFEIFKRPPEMSIVEYITEFERLYDRLKVHDMNYADAVLAYKLLINANISEEKQSMCRATMVKLTFANIKRQLKVIHDSTGIGTQNDGQNVTVKEEHVFETEYSDSDNFFAQSNRGPGRPWNRGGRQSRGYRGNYGFNNRGHPQRNWRSMGEPDRDKKKNPLDKYGRVTKCGICQSILHWARDCPDRESGTGEQISLFSNEIQGPYLPQFLKETINCAILDCGCVKSVCGSKWLDIYTQSLSKDEQEQIDEKPSNARFRFGVGGPVYTSERKINLPAILGKKKVLIETDIIDCDLPLLLSKESMKRAETEICFKNDEVSMLGERLKLQFTSSGHYAVPLGHDQLKNKKMEMEEVFLALEELDKDNKLKACRKLHIQFGHARASRLQDLLKDANVTDKETLDMVKEVEEKCETCTKFRKPQLRPVVGFALAKDFNDMVSMDLKFHNTTPWLHMIDHSTRFSAACVIPDKRQETIIENVFKHWIGIFGSPKRILTDNGCEFNNNAMRELGDLLGVEVRTTAAESPWSNGITERHNCLIGSMLNKIITEQNCSLGLALAWAVNAKNTLANVFGYSPHQLVFGKNPSLPGVLTDKLPALEGTTSSQIIADHLNAMAAARKAFIAAEASDKLKRALNRQTRPATSLIYETNDKVFYKRNGTDRWRGPGVVIGKEKHQVFIKHGGVYVRVNPCHLRHVNEELTFSNENSEKDDENSEKDTGSENPHDKDNTSSDTDTTNKNSRKAESQKILKTNAICKTKENTKSDEIHDDDDSEQSETDDDTNPRESNDINDFVENPQTDLDRLRVPNNQPEAIEVANQSDRMAPVESHKPLMPPTGSKIPCDVERLEVVLQQADLCPS